MNALGCLGMDDSILSIYILSIQNKIQFVSEVNTRMVPDVPDAPDRDEDVRDVSDRGEDYEVRDEDPDVRQEETDLLS